MIAFALTYLLNSICPGRVHIGWDILENKGIAIFIREEGTLQVLADIKIDWQQDWQQPDQLRIVANWKVPQ